jgi:hypothetical protein
MQDIDECRCVCGGWKPPDEGRCEECVSVYLDEIRCPGCGMLFDGSMCDECTEIQREIEYEEFKCPGCGAPSDGSMCDDCVDARREVEAEEVGELG